MGPKKRRHSSPSKDGSSKKQKSFTEITTLEDAIAYLAAGKITALEAKSCIEILRHASQETGLSPDHITALISVVSNDCLGKGLRKMLVPCLVPSEYVPEMAVIKAICLITSPTCPVTIQVEILKWICAIYTVIDSTKRLACLYGVLFPCLDSALMQPHVCRLLFLMTKKEHVMKYRVNILIRLQSQLGPQPHILALLQLYANHRPDIVMTNFKFKTAFKSLGKNYEKIAKKSVDNEVVYGKVDSIMLKTEITSYSELTQLLDTCQSGTVGLVEFLKSPIRRSLFLSNLPEAFMIRLRMFLKTALFTETSWVSSTVKYSRNEILPLLADICFELQEGIPDVYTFVAQFLEVWDGLRHQTEILRLISYWELCQFGYLEPILHRLFMLFCHSSVKFQCDVLECLTNLYKNWVLFEVPRIQSRKGKLSKYPGATEQITLFERYGDDTVVPKDQIEALAEFIGKLCTASLEIPRNPSTILLYHILDFYKMDLRVHTICPYSAFHLPSSIVLSSLTFTTCPLILSQTCQLICGYKEAIKELKKMSASIPQIATINAFLEDLCNMLALGRAFEGSTDSLFFNESLPHEIVGTIHKPQRCFMLHRHPAILGVTLHYVSKLRDEPDVHALFADSRARMQFLKYLDKFGFGGIKNFFQTFVRKM